MNRTRAIFVVIVLGALLIVGAGMLTQFVDQQNSKLEPLHGLIGSEKEPFFQDPRVIEIFEREGLEVKVQKASSPEFQQDLMAQTLRRPAISSVRPSAEFPDQLLVELPFPNSLEVIDALLFAYLDQQSLPSHSIFVLDLSGSMEGDGLNQLKDALNNLTGQDTSLTGQFARFRNRERITMLPFSEHVLDVREFEIDIEDPSTLNDIRDYVSLFQASGDTAIYSSLQQAYDLALAAQEQDPSRHYSIVLMSDGKNTVGTEESDFLRIG
jgi:Ca-activated chloride channel family protein